MACIAVADSAFVYLGTKDSYSSGDTIDLRWAAGFLLLTVAAAAGRRMTAAKATPISCRGASIWLPYAPLLLAALVAAASRPAR